MLGKVKNNYVKKTAEYLVSCFSYHAVKYTYRLKALGRGALLQQVSQDGPRGHDQLGHRSCFCGEVGDSVYQGDRTILKSGKM